MNYVYDIILNFQKEYYDFFEWNNNDEILHIRKIPIFKVSNNEYKLFKYGNVKFDKDFMHKIHNKTEKFKKTNYSNVNYVFLISNSKETMAIKLNKNGINKYKSSLLLEEEDEICDIASNLNPSKINYKIIKNNTNYNYQTRKEKEINKIIMKKLNTLYTNKENDKLKYLYLECFNKNETSITKIYNTLKQEVINHTQNEKTIYNFFKIIGSKQKG